VGVETAEVGGVLCAEHFDELDLEKKSVKNENTRAHTHAQANSERCYKLLGLLGRFKEQK
jgi:hypothetical protein